MKTRRQFLKTIGLGVVTLAYHKTFFCSPAEFQKPNIVLILADDMGWSDIGCYGGEIHTPNLDRLAKGGIRFTQMHNTAKCFPSRACLLTGLYAQQCNMDRQPGEFKNSVTLGEVLQSAGYRTLMAGKHHSTENPYDRGFSRYFGLRDGACNYFNPGKQRPGEEKPAQKRPDRAWCIDDKLYQPYTPEEKDFYTTDYFTKYALQYLEEYKDENKPFFLYLAYNAPHDPLMAWPEDIKKYRGKYKVGYEEIRQKRDEKQREIGLFDRSFPQSKFIHKKWDSLREEEKEEEDLKMAVYAAMIDRLDWNIGKILTKVQELGKAENTLVIFASDNGCSAEVVNIPGSGEIGSKTRWTSLGGDWANVSNTPFRYYKNYSHEGGICTPFIAYWPAIIKDSNRISHHMGHFIDVMATFIDITGATYPGKFRGEKIVPLEGKSLLPIFLGQKAEEHEALFWQWSRGKAVRKGKWKLVSWRDEWELFDVEVDKTETNNLAEKYPDVVRELIHLHEEWQKKCATII
jgi:arylsulfatase A-like enzyme